MIVLVLACLSSEVMKQLILWCLTQSKLFVGLESVCQELPKLTHKLLSHTATGIMISVFSIVVFGLCPSQLLVRPEHSRPDEPDHSLSSIQLMLLYPDSRHIVTDCPYSYFHLSYLPKHLFDYRARANRCWHLLITSGSTSVHVEKDDVLQKVGWQHVEAWSCQVR